MISFQLVLYRVLVDMKISLAGLIVYLYWRMSRGARLIWFEIGFETSCWDFGYNSRESVIRRQLSYIIILLQLKIDVKLVHPGKTIIFRQYFKN
jgi:hypothetical protein